MTRDIKFRGLRSDGLGWVYGDLLQNYIHHKTGATIQQSGVVVYEVIADSVGQYTGLKDVDGVEIFEEHGCNKRSEILYAMKEFAIEVAMETLNNVTKNVRMKTKDNVDELSLLDEWTMVDKNSILNKNNIPKI